MTTTERTLEVPGASLYYEIRGSGPVLILIALRGDSVGFASIAPLLASDYTVVTYDPRGISRSTIEDSSQDASPDLIADDVHRLLTVVSTEPAYVFGSSGGAIAGLALATARPGQTRSLVAHEPPLVELLPDRQQMLAAIDEVYDTYRTQGPASHVYSTRHGSRDDPPARNGRDPVDRNGRQSARMNCSPTPQGGDQASANPPTLNQDWIGGTGYGVRPDH